MGDGAPNNEMPSLPTTSGETGLEGLAEAVKAKQAKIKTEQVKDATDQLVSTMERNGVLEEHPDETPPEQVVDGKEHAALKELASALGGLSHIDLKRETPPSDGAIAEPTIPEATVKKAANSLQAEAQGANDPDKPPQKAKVTSAGGQEDPAAGAPPINVETSTNTKQSAKPDPLKEAEDKAMQAKLDEELNNKKSKIGDILSRYRQDIGQLRDPNNKDPKPVDDPQQVTPEDINRLVKALEDKQASGKKLSGQEQADLLALRKLQGARINGQQEMLNDLTAQLMDEKDPEKRQKLLQERDGILNKMADDTSHKAGKLREAYIKSQEFLSRFSKHAVDHEKKEWQKWRKLYHDMKDKTSDSAKYAHELRNEAFWKFIKYGMGRWTGFAALIALLIPPATAFGIGGFIKQMK